MSRSKKIEKALRLLLKVVAHGRPSDPRDVDLWDAAVRRAERSLPKRRPRGVWIEFADDGKTVTDVMHEPKDAIVPDSFVWCEEA